MLYFIPPQLKSSFQFTSSLTVFTNSVGGGHSGIGGQSSQHDVASEILSIGPIQLDDLTQTDLVTPITITASTPASGGQQIITTPISTASG